MAIKKIINYQSSIAQLVTYWITDWKVVSFNPTRSQVLSHPAPDMGDFTGSMGRLVPPGWVSSTVRTRQKPALGSMTLAIGDVWNVWKHLANIIKSIM